MFWYKLCPRCHGDLMADRDEYGKFIRCMQCGFIRDISINGGMLINPAESMPVPGAITSDGAELKRHSNGARRFRETAVSDADELCETAA